MIIKDKDVFVMEIIYREADSSDAEELLLHIKRVGGETDNLSFGFDSFNITPEREAKFIRRFSLDKRDIMLLATSGNTVVGNAVLEHERIPRYAHRATLSVTVLKEFWGRGIGKRLLEILIDHAGRVGTSVISLEVRVDNERAISLYKKMGFSVIGRYQRFFKIKGEYFDALLMQLCL